MYRNMRARCLPSLAGIILICGCATSRQVTVDSIRSPSTSAEARNSIAWVLHAIEIYEDGKAKLHRGPPRSRFRHELSNDDPYLHREHNRMTEAYEQLLEELDWLEDQEKALRKQEKRTQEAQQSVGGDSGKAAADGALTGAPQR
jgi:hypothetical protein